MSNEIPVFKFATLNNDPRFLPQKSHTTDTGWDVRAAAKTVLIEGNYGKIPLGFRMFAPPGYWLELRPRSSSFVKRHLSALYGVIDEGYENEMIFACQYSPDMWEKCDGYCGYRTLTIEEGDAIGQIIPVRRQEMIVEQVSEEEYQRLTLQRKGTRGAGGFGSTDKK